jgi:hypothetical protein
MFFRVIFAAILGGAFVFGAAFAEHMVFDWTGRAFKKPENEAALREELKTHFKEPGIYGTPSRPDNFNQLTFAEKKKMHEDLAPIYKQGAAWVVVPPTNEDMMNNQQLYMQYGASALAALCVAVVLSLTRPEVGFLGRWFAAIVLGMFCWLATSASYFIWYRYPWAYIQDELLCKLLEWAAGGFIIALIVRPRFQSMQY